MNVQRKLPNSQQKPGQDKQGHHADDVTPRLLLASLTDASEHKISTQD